MIELKHVRKSFEQSTPIKDVSCVINQGDVISIIGPSGTGKSTLLKCINMLSAPTSGQIIVDGQDITAKGYDINQARKKIGMVFQHFNLFNHLTIAENVMNPQIDLLKRTPQQAYDKAYSLLKRVGLAGKMLQYPEQLSGGQKQRVAICRTLAMDPEIILFDEPTSALDPTMVGEVQTVISDLAKEGHTMMIVTHEMNFAKEISNRVFYMDEGGIYEDGTPEQIFENPQREKTRIFIKQLKVLEIKIDDANFDFQAIVYKINEYCNKNQLSPKIANKLNAAFEELCKQIIIPSFTTNDIDIDVVIEYSSKDDDITLEVKYNGRLFNPKDSDNDIAFKIFCNSVKNYEYQSINEENFTNRIIAKM